MRIARHVLIFAHAVRPCRAGAVCGAQAPPDVWKTFASRIDVGVQLNVRLRNGQKFRATLIDAREDVLLLQPKTRVPVPVQPVAYEAIVSLEQVKGGMAAAPRPRRLAWRQVSARSSRRCSSSSRGLRLSASSAICRQV